MLSLPDTLPEGEAFVPPGRNVAVFRDGEGVFAISTVCTHLGLHRENERERISIVRVTVRVFTKTERSEKGRRRQPLPWLKVSKNGGDADR